MLWRIKFVGSIFLLSIVSAAAIVSPGDHYKSSHWLIGHKDSCCRAEDSPNKMNLRAASVEAATLPCVVEACRKTGKQLPQVCPTGDLKFSAEEGNLVNLTSNSRPKFSCTWICVHDTRRDLAVRHGAWALVLIDSDSIIY